MSTMSKEMNGTVKVQKDRLVSCLTCRICNDLFIEATTISECLHAFCKKCIHEKLEDEEFPCCPVCKIDLGSTPLEKLRPDHSLQDLRAKLFPFAVEQIGSSDAVSPNPSPAKPKERLLSSFDAPSPQSSTNETRKDLKASELKSSSSSAMETSKASDKGKQKIYTEEGRKNEENKTELKRSKRLVEAARKKAVNNNNNNNDNKDGSSQDAGADSVSLAELIENMAVSRAGKRGKRPKVNGGTGKGLGSGSQSGPGRAQKAQQAKKESTATTVSAGALRFNPIWFSLIASNDLEGHELLPQLTSHFLRVTDGNMTVSTLKKYIANKLNLSEEVEIVIALRGEPVMPNLTLKDLVEKWIQTEPEPKKISVSVGSSGEEAVMVVNYCRKAQPLA